MIIKIVSNHKFNSKARLRNYTAMWENKLSHYYKDFANNNICICINKNFYTRSSKGYIHRDPKSHKPIGNFIKRFYIKNIKFFRTIYYSPNQFYFKDFKSKDDPLLFKSSTANNDRFYNKRIQLKLYMSSYR